MNKEIEQVENLVLDGVPARDAFQSVFKSYKTFQLRYPRDYRRLLYVAKGVKAASKGGTIRDVSKVVGISEVMLRHTYPSLWELCRRVKRETRLSKVAYVSEVLATSGDVSLATITETTGEGIGVVYQAWNRYYGLEDVNQYGLKSKV